MAVSTSPHLNPKPATDPDSAQYRAEEARYRQRTGASTAVSTSPMLHQTPTARAIPREEPRTSTFGRGVARGIKQTGGLFGQVTKLIGDELGVVGMMDFGDELVQEAFVEAVVNPGEIHELSDIKGLGDLGTFALQMLGEQVPNLGVAAFTGGIGAYAGRQLVGRQVGRALTKKIAPVRGQLDVEDVLARYMRRNPTVGAAAGGAAGGFAGFLPINTGEIIQESVDAGLEPSLGGSLALGAASSSLEILGFGLIGRAIFKEAKREVVNHTLGNVLRRVGHTSLKGLAAEAGTEAAQEAIVIASKKLNDPTFSINDAILSSEGLSRIAFAGAAGGVVGGLLGGAGGAVTNTAQLLAVGAERARIRSTEVRRDIRNAFNPGQDDQIPVEEGEARSIQDVERAQPKMDGLFDAWQKRIDAWFDDSKDARRLRMPQGELTAARAALASRADDLIKTIETELETLDVADQQLAETRVNVAAILNRFKQGLDSIEAVEEKSKAQNNASRKMFDEISALLAEAKAKKGKERAAMLDQLMAKAEEFIGQGLFNHGNVAKSKLQNLLNSLRSYSAEAFKAKQDENAAYRDNLVDMLETVEKDRDAAERKFDRLNEARNDPDIEQQLEDEAVRAARAGEAAEQAQTETAADAAAAFGQAAERAAADQRLKTPKKEVVQSVSKLLKGKENEAFAVGYANEKDLPKWVQKQIKQGKVIVEEGDGELLLKRRGDPRSIEEAKQAAFDTQVEDIADPTNAYVVKDVASDGSRSEVVPDLAAAQDVARKIRDKGGKPKIIKPHEGIEEQLDQLEQEAAVSAEEVLKAGKGPMSQFYRAITGLNIVTGLRTAMKKAGLDPVLATADGRPGRKGRQITIATIPNDLQIFEDGTTWGDLKENKAWAEELAELVLALDSKFANPDLFAERAHQNMQEKVEAFESMMDDMPAGEGQLDPTEIFGMGMMRPSDENQVKVGYFANSGNGRLVPVEIVIVEGERVVRPLDPNVTLKNTRNNKKQTPLTKEDLEGKIENATSKPLLIGAQATSVEQVGDTWVVRADYEPDFDGFHILVQINRAIWRGNNDKEKGASTYIVEATRPTGTVDKKGNPRRTKVWLHLGEITKLGERLRRFDGPKTSLNRLTEAHTNFMHGLAVLRADYGFDIDFYPHDLIGFDKKGRARVIKEEVKGHRWKKIYGQMTYNASLKTQDDKYVIQNIFQNYILNNPEALGRAAESGLVGPFTSPNKDWKSVMDFLLDEARQGMIDRGGETNVGQLLFNFGLLDANYLESVQRDSEESGRVATDVSQQFSEIQAGRKQTKESPSEQQTGTYALYHEVYYERDSETGALNPTYTEEYIKARYPAEDRAPTFEFEDTPPTRGVTSERVESQVGDLPVDREEQETIAGQTVDTSVMQSAPGKRQQQRVVNTLTHKKGIWSAAGKATKWVTDYLGIKEKIVLFDEDSAQALADGYASQAEYYLKKGERDLANLYNRYAVQIEEILETKTSKDKHGQLNTEKLKTPQEHRIQHIFVSKKKSTRKAFTRQFILAHELGHLVQHTHFDTLPKKLQKEIVAGFGKADLMPGQKYNKKTATAEAFANWMAKWMADIAEGKVGADILESEKSGREPSKTDQEIYGFFKALNKKLHDVWKALKRILREPYIVLLRDGTEKTLYRSYPEGFSDFVQALVTHSETRHSKHARPNASEMTPLARRIFMSLQGDGLQADIWSGKHTSEVGTWVAPQARTGIDNLETRPNAETAAEEAQDSVFKSYVDNFQNWARTFRDNPREGMKMILYTADGELRSMGEFGTRLANKFHALPGMKTSAATIFNQIRIAAAPHFADLQTLLDSMPNAKVSWREMVGRTENLPPEVQARREHRQRVTEALLKHTPENELAPDIRREVRDVRKYLEGLHTWFTQEMGIPLNKVPDYYPMMLDTMVVDKNREDFVEILTRHGFTERQAQAIRQKVTRDENGGLVNNFNEDAVTDFDFQGPGMASARRRATPEKGWTEDLKNDLIDAGFYQQDIATTLIMYTEMATRRAVWQKNFGLTREERQDNTVRNIYTRVGINPNNPIAKLQYQLARAHARGELTEWQYQRVVHDILPAYAGQLGLRTHSSMRKLNSYMVIYQNLRLLAFAIFAQFVDISTVWWRGDFQAAQKGMNTLLNKADRQEAYEMLGAIGAMRQGLTEHVLNDQALNTFMTGRAKRINDMFFHYNMMEGWTNMMRAMALASGRDFIQRNAEKAANGDEKARRYIEELGLDVAEARAWDGHSTDNINIAAALNRYIDEAMIRPDPTIRPVWMSDPGYSIFSHLKGFLYGFQKTFLQRAYHEAKVHQNLLPMVSLGLLALPFAAVGFELRRKITGSRQNLEGANYVVELVERAGLFGAFQLVADMEQAEEYGKPFVLGLTGPAVEQMAQFLDDPTNMGAYMPKAIPVVASVPAMRDWVRNTLGD